MLEWAYRLGPWRGSDLVWLTTVWLASRGPHWLAQGRRLPGRGPGRGEGMTAVLMRIPAHPVAARALVRRKLASWPVVGTRVYVGCPIGYPAMLDAVAATGGDPRLRIVVIDSPDMPDRAGCLDRLYAALEEDERRGRFRARFIVLDDEGDQSAN